MARISSDACENDESDVNGASEMMDLLQMDFDPEAVKEREETLLSRNALRKQQRWEKCLAAKKSRRKEEKHRRKLQRHQPPDAMESPHFTKRVTKAMAKERLAEAQSTGVQVCVDLGMADCMSDKEVSRLAGQLRRLYGSNRKATRPFHLILSDLRKDSRLYRECLRMNDGFMDYVMEVTDQSCLDLFPLQTLVYLSPDAEEVLETVNHDKVYVLGGLVDESIQEKLSLSRAGELGVASARLPIDEYMVKKNNSKNFHSKVLAVNQVFDILLTFCESGSWTRALQAGVPLGKGYIVAPGALRTPDVTD
ncbi:tRNA methyltransferase 10 homolog B isoform X2 [Thalassophryne amazonica]|uniref:tRNA methyltransferase 10 homolog B isoform X2 n=1 Tax=Thalassophryne amazonica TaxID=390379 RepID=UPI0014717AA7|nr:tRNA methyltransferase 10 homolog B isoform X2 [Thalassophryne amazonica]